MSFVNENLHISVLGTENYFTNLPLLGNFGIAPIMESSSGFDKALKAYCNLFFSSCKNAPSCMQNQINMETSIYYADWGHSYPYSNTLQLCYERGAFDSSSLLMWALIIGGILIVVGIVMVLVLLL